MNSEEIIIRIIRDTGLSRDEIKLMIELIIANQKGKISIKEALFTITRELIVDLS